MALQSSGQISLNEIHIEAGGTTGTEASINDSDIRGLISKSSGAAMNFAEWYGASSSLDTQTVTSEISGTYGSSQYFQGYRTGVHGSISDGTSNIYSGATIEDLYSSHFYTTDKVFLNIQGNRANSGWTTMTFNGVSYQRSSATYAYSSSLDRTQWQWLISPQGNPFGHTSGTLAVSVVFA